MRALFIYNPNSGHHITKRKLDYIKRELNGNYDIFDVIESNSKEHFIELVKFHASKYDVLIISGGDGSINMALSSIAKLDKKPVLGLVPLGTINDCIRSYGLSTNFKKSIQIIKQGKTKKVDIFKINDSYAGYVAAFGAFSDIPYITGNRFKKIFGRFAYYFHAIPRVFQRERIKGKIIFKDQEVVFITPFMIIMNGRRMGGFTINKNAKVDDGLADIYYAKPGLFNSLLKYFFTRHKLIHFQANNFKIEIDNYLWDIDGEKGPQGNVEVTVLHQFIEIFG